ncbi:MAG: sugar ABC transporter permease [Anaerolineae bacterium]|nr:sugar ABC transporter permease [Anaerolineae bacterium]
MRQQRLWGFLMVSPWVIGFLAFTLGPMVASIYFSFTDYNVLKPPSFVGLRNFVELFTDDYRHTIAIYNTVYYSVFQVPLSLALALAVAVLLNQGMPGENLFRTVYYLPSVVSGVALSMLWLWLFDPSLGLVNLFLERVGIRGPLWLQHPNWSKPALILMSFWGIGRAMVIFLAALQGVPAELYDASMVDGAAWLQKIRHVTLPLITPTIFFNLVMGIIGSFQVFTNAYIMTRGGPANSTLFYVLYLYYNAFQYLRMGYASAMAWVLFLVVLFFTFVVFRSSGRWVYYESPAPLTGRA